MKIIKSLLNKKKMIFQINKLIIKIMMKINNKNHKLELLLIKINFIKEKSKNKIILNYYLL